MSKELVEAIPIPALLVGRDGRILVGNIVARQLFGDVIEQRHYITVLRQPNLLDAVENAMSTGEQATAQFLTTQARRDIMFQVTCSPLTDGTVLIVLEDRTPMEEAFQIRRDFVANVSHELRTPLTALLGFIETLRGAARNDEVARTRFLGIMEREASRMNRLVADLLSLSRVEAEERVRPTEPIAFTSIVRSVIHSLEPLAEAEGVRLNPVLPEEDIVLPGDDDQLSQVATNLIENAIKYSPPETEIDVLVRTEPEHPMIRGEAVILVVQDRGEGIDPVHIPRLTERFYRVDSHRSREMGGTGLGLAIVKHIVNRHRGRLRIESAPGKGSRFSVILPASAKAVRTN